MVLTKLKFITTVLIPLAGLVGWNLAGSLARAEKPVGNKASEGTKSGVAGSSLGTTKLDLTPETFPELHKLIRPHDNEWRHLKVQWLTDVVAARKKAAAEDKPIIICYTGGAGYNEPLGTC